MSKRFKPKVRITAGQYRIVEGEYGFHIERNDGIDRMHVRRWRDLTDEERAQPWRISNIVESIGGALRARATRKRRASK